MRIQKSAEDYLEMILRLHETKGYARAIDISYGLSVTKPSVSVAMRNLRENGYITVDESRNIHLTDAGMAIAERIYERHKLLTELLVSIGVDAGIAEKDACLVEHDLSPETFEAIRERYSAGERLTEEVIVNDTPAATLMKLRCRLAGNGTVGKRFEH